MFNAHAFSQDNPSPTIRISVELIDPQLPRGGFSQTHPLSRTSNPRVSCVSACDFVCIPFKSRNTLCLLYAVICCYMSVSASSFIIILFLPREVYYFLSSIEFGPIVAGQSVNSRGVDRSFARSISDRRTRT